MPGQNSSQLTHHGSAREQSQARESHRALIYKYLNRRDLSSCKILLISNRKAVLHLDLHPPTYQVSGSALHHRARS